MSKGAIVETKSQILLWMTKSVVGCQSPDLNFDELCEEIVKEGMTMLKARYMGDNLVLIITSLNFPISITIIYMKY